MQVFHNCAAETSIMATKKTDVPLTTTNSELADALVQAMEAVKPVVKKTVFTRKKNTPWTPKDGSPKLKLKRKMYQHGLEIQEATVSNEEIALLNKIQPGTYCDGWVKVNKRKDKGLDIDYPIKTASQRLKFGFRDFTEFLQRLVVEAAAPKVNEYALVDDED